VKKNPINQCDFLIIGAGILGLTMAREILRRYPTVAISILEKEYDVAQHASGRNSGVLHAGFYYSSNSFKAKFTSEGNKALRKYCLENKIYINECKKVVVAHDEFELKTLFELERRGIENGSEVYLVDEKQLADIEPNAVTFGKALYSPRTGTVDPAAICRVMRAELESAGVIFRFEHAFERRLAANAVQTNRGVFEFQTLVNCAGLYADQIAKEFEFSQNYKIIPFKGMYLKYTGSDRPIRTNIYPVPNLKNPFLGVHFTVTNNGQIKIGPTAIPAFWRENYSGFHGFKFSEFLEILGLETRLFYSNKFGFRNLAYEEVLKYQRKYFVGLAQKMVKSIDPDGFTEWTRPGIRAQLLNMKTLELVQDFVVEGDRNSIHILNAVSPAFTGSIPFAKWIVSEFIERPIK
jgi:(S)-2-hydroxyglutarate dehydrogenase